MYYGAARESFGHHIVLDWQLQPMELDLGRSILDNPVLKPSPSGWDNSAN